MYRIGIDLGGTNIVAGLVDENRHILDGVSVKTNAPRAVDCIVDDMAQMVSRLTERNGLSLRDIASVGVGVPCTANPENGHMEDADNVGYEDTPFLTLLKDKLGIPVCFENDDNAAAWGEYLTGGYEEDSFLMVTIGTGIGGVSRAGEALLLPLQEKRTVGFIPEIPNEKRKLCWRDWTMMPECWARRCWGRRRAEKPVLFRKERSHETF